MELDAKATKRAKTNYNGIENSYISLHNNKYDYSKAVYLNGKTKMCIICPEHGEFWQCHNKHYNSKQGCPACAGKLRKTTKQFVDEAEKVHGDRYDYSKAVYTNQYNNVTIICPRHGAFEQAPTNHLAGKRCLKCATEERGENHRLTFKNFLIKANDVHANKYKYKNYIKASAKVTITCPMHGDFEQEATGHMAGKGCPKCGKYGFQPNQPAILYYLEINDGKVYKIGVTNRTVNERFYVSELKNIKSVFTINLKTGSEALKLETAILRKFKSHKYTGEDLLSSGNTELFNKNIFENLTIYSIKSIEEFINEYPRN